ncbi:hypothetical protein COT42_02435 [Candidatus Saganbacteria bacterium CG08_land_8_20_14_0_20_45_16]|uniref:Uncharacterized protein n=1 Tax=Candidatus Saganbacteria bacterium CG08_land_8_20_14_0_20_45_16 TaxID=2014293 RepID=A0A2H0Y2B4_UNCSA|nr:MAG: hypothetical protein COT42_02435 [Candidatus Saganbacteria bacterium CG08_land_8_20_14_0_20_45_16]
MSESADKNNYDVASISRPGQDKRANYVQFALEYDYTKVTRPGQFIKVFADMFLRKEGSNRGCF